MTVRILGPLDTGGPKLSPRERTILSALIVRRAVSVSPDELADACWGESPPQTWQQQIRNSVAKIRSRLGPEAVRTVGVDYRLGIGDDAVDAVQFERAVSQARRHGLEGAHDRAIATYRRALDLWRGAPLPDVASWPPAQIETMRLSEIRADAEEELLDARLRAGERAEAIPDAERLVREEPLREHRWAILALANYRADRQADAMAVLRTARTRLSEDLGVDPSAGLSDLEAAILRQDADLAAPAPSVPAGASASAACPYLGLNAYDVDDRAVFFGREAEIEVVRERCVPGTVVAVVGPSGSGKSSFVRAGIVPPLQEQGRDVVIATPSLARIEGLRDTVRARASVICIDQAEELAALPAEQVRDLAAELRTWLDDGGLLILTLRSDVLDRAIALPSLGAAIGRGVYALGPLDEAGLRAAITGPADASGIRLESGLIEVILRDAGGRPGILPALSHALVATWRHREGSTLTIEGYEAAGGIAGAIAQSAENVYRDLSPGGQDACRSLMMRLVERTPEGATVRRRVPLGTLTADPVRRGVVEGLVAARLVTVDGDAATIAHEAVGRTWPRLDSWLTDDAENARMLRHVEAAALAWDAGGRGDEDLMGGSRLHAAIEWREDANPDLTSLESAFLDASDERHTREVRELAARSEQERSVNRRLRLSLAAAAILLVAALVSGGIAAIRGGEAVASAQDASIEALAATSLSIRDGDRDLAALLAAELYRRWPDDSRARSALLGSVTASAGLTRRVLFEEGSLVNGAFIPGTRSALAIVDTPSEDADVSATPRLLIIDLDTGATVRELHVELPPVVFGIERDIVVSADGSTAFVQTGTMRPGDPPRCCVNYLTAIDLTIGAPLFDTLRLDQRTNQKPTVTADGSRAYFVHFVTGSPSWIDLASGEVVNAAEHDPDEFADIPGRINGVTLIDEILYVGMGDRIEAYDPHDLSPTGTIDLPEDGLSEALLLDDGDGGLIAAGDDGVARVDLDAGEVIWSRTADELRCVDGFADGTHLVCVAATGIITVSDVETGLPTGREFDTLSDQSRTASPTDDRTEVVTFTSRSPASLQVWRVDGMPDITRAFADGRTPIEGFGDAGRLLITTEGKDLAPELLPGGVVVDSIGEFQLWDVAADEPVGAAAEGLTWVSDTVVARLSDDTWSLQNVLTGDTYPLDLFPEEFFWPYPGGPGEDAFAVSVDGLVAFDPSTGNATSGVVAISHDGSWTNSVSEIGESGHVSLSFWDDTREQDHTAVYDVESGILVAEGLDHDVLSLGTPDGHLLSANGGRLTRSTAELERVEAIATSGAAPHGMSVSSDGRTLMIATLDQKIALYDLTDDRRLGDAIAIPFDPDVFWPVGYLRSDGEALATNSLEGIHLWDIRAKTLRDAACALVGRDMTPLEWSTHFGDEEFASTCEDAERDGG